ncbi:MAG: Uncharacterized MFS-type transporter [uncultured Paraburkholderia sp.]|nr:MAG: Uncharacterized MFS-type transporter [uncultured Paraburkholderia sp.]CAH2946090.1 MAG: Uncharacterized MFS-type transporter [uncultured Paraburkholderia sp.]
MSCSNGSRLATRMAFFVSGFGVACWAPLIPIAKSRLEMTDGALGLLLLCLGLGSIISMQLAGPLTSRFGARLPIVIGGIIMAFLLPCLASAPTVPLLAATLLSFGAFQGLLEVGMNVHAVEVERRAAKPLMSGFHGLFSIGGFAGSTLTTFMLSARISATVATIMSSVLMLAAIFAATPRLIETTKTDDAPLLVLPKGVVVLLAVLAAIAFLTEGAMLDWGALLLSGKGLLPVEKAGMGYSVFAVAMTVGRFTGDAIVARIGGRRTMFWGGVLAVLGYVVLLVAPISPIALLGFLLVGLGASNTVPVLFRLAGNQSVMPAGLAIASVTTMGYAGILLGPAGIGFLAQGLGLSTALWLLTALLFLIPLCAGFATGSQTTKPPRSRTLTSAIKSKQNLNE